MSLCASAGVAGVVLLLAGCAPAGEPPDEVQSSPETASVVADDSASDPSEQAQPGDGPVATQPPEPRAPSPEAVTSRPTAAATVEIDCPDDLRYPWGSTAEVTFGYYITDPAAVVEQWSMQYGDASAYTAESREDAETNLFWHDYDTPGTYTALATLTDALGRTATDTCTFTFSWEDPPQAAPPPSTGSGASGGMSPSGWTDCYFKSVPMWGDVQVVDYAADFTVQVVDYAADLSVQSVEYGATSCGQWQFVDYAADFTVQVVDYAADFTIDFVDYAPGR